jgi:dienelactone hydrolase
MCTANSTLSIGLPSYVPQTVSSYAAAATLATGMYCLSSLYAKYSNPPALTINLDTINAFTCTPIKHTHNTIPWHTVVEQVQEGTIANNTAMQIESNNSVSIAIEKGITAKPEHDTVFLFSRGYAARGSLIGGKPLPDEYQDIVNNGGGLMVGHMCFKDNLITQTPCYVFDYSDTLRYLNIGQSHDVHYLKTAWEEVLRTNPDAKIVAIGDCRGSKTLLEFATQKPNNLKAMVLMAPFISLHELACHIAQNYVPLPYSDKILHALMRYGLPNVNLEHDNLAERLPLIDPKLPIFIAHRLGDTLISYNDIQLLVKALHKNGNAVYLLEITDTSAAHSRLSHLPELQQALNAFYAKYQLPHNSTLAKEGKELLEKAQHTAQAMASENK